MLVGHTAAAAVVLFFGAAILAGQPLDRWGVVPDPQLSRHADLVGVALGEIPGMKLVEREQLDKVLSELTMSALLGPDAAAKRLQMGALLSADALLFLAIEKQRDKESVQLVVSDCRYGARIAQEYFPGDVDGQTLARRARQVAEDLRKQFASGVTSMVAVPAFRCGDLGYENRHLQDGLANVLRSALLAAPGMAVLELDEVRAIQQELGLAGAPGVARSVIPIFVEGDYRIESKAETPVVKLKIASTAAGRRQENQREFASVDAAAAHLRDVVAAEVIQAAKAGGAPLPLERQVALLSQRADQFTSVGSVYRATGLREAILLLDPSNAEQTRRLVREYAEVVPFKSQMDWSRVPRDEALQSLGDRLGLWRRALDLVARLIGRRQVTQVDAILLLRALDEAMSDFRSRHALAESPAAQPELVEELGRQMGTTSRAELEFVHGVALSIPALESGDASRLRRRAQGVSDTNPPTSAPSRADAREAREAWLTYLTNHAGYSRFGPATQVDRLGHYAWCLEHPLKDERRIFGFVSEFTSMCADPDTRDAFQVSTAALEEWVQRLERSPSVAAQVHGRLCRLVYDRYIGPDGATTLPEQALKRLDEWKSYAEPLGFRDARFVELLRQRIAPSTERAQGAKEPTTQSRPALRPAAQLAIEEVAIHVKRTGGERLTLADWLLLPFGPNAILDDHVLACGSFDTFWNGWSIRVQRVPGEMQEVWFRVRHGHPGIHDVAFDGRHIWAITCCEGVMVFDETGRQVARLAVGDQLPAAHAGARLACIEPGRMLAAGSFGPDKRAWCATLTLGDQAVACDVFHEATTVFTDPKKLETSFDDPTVVFIPSSIYRLESPGQRPRFLVQRAIAEERRIGWVFEPGFLEVDLEHRRVAVLDYKMNRYRVSNDQPRLAFVGTDCMRINADEIEKYPAPQPGAKHVRLFRNKDEFFGSEFHAWDDVLVIRGLKSWYQLDAKTWNVSELGQWPADVPKEAGFSWTGVSSVHGLITWNSEGQYFRVLGQQQPAQVAKGLSARGAELRKRVAADPRDWAAWRALTWELYSANLVDEARQACLDWIAQFPRRAEPRFALADVEKKRLTGLGAWDHPPQENQKFASLAVWLLYNSPSEGQETMQAAIRLPAAENPEQWFIAEVAFLSVADYRTACGRNHAVIETCDRWQQEAEQRGGSGDASYFIFRAAARLRLGEFAAARADAKAALEAERQGRAWATGAERLLAAIDAQQKDFRYDCEPPVYDSRCWWPESK